MHDRPPPSVASSPWLLRAALILYSVSGWATPLLLDALRLSEPSAVSSSSSPAHGLPNLKPMLANTLGMALAWLFSTGGSPGSSTLVQTLRRLPYSAPIWRRLVAVAVVDFVSGFMLIQGALVIGSNLFVVLYTSCTLWTALLSRWLLRRSPSLLQWFAILAITAGLSGDAVASVASVGGSEEGGSRGGGENGVRGTFLVLVGSSLHSLMFVQAEALSSGTALAGCCNGDTASGSAGDPNDDDDDDDDGGSGGSGGKGVEAAPSLLLFSVGVAGTKSCRWFDDSCCVLPSPMLLASSSS